MKYFDNGHSEVVQASLFTKCRWFYWKAISWSNCTMIASFYVPAEIVRALIEKTLSWVLRTNLVKLHWCGLHWWNRWLGLGPVLTAKSSKVESEYPIIKFWRQTINKPIKPNHPNFIFPAENHSHYTLLYILDFILFQINNFELL